MDQPPRQHEAEEIKRSTKRANRDTKGDRDAASKSAPLDVRGDFLAFAFRTTYLRFLQRYLAWDEIADRGTVEEAWVRVIKNKWDEWKPNRTEDERKAALEHALSQVRFPLSDTKLELTKVQIHGSEKFDVESFWQCRRYSRKQFKGLIWKHASTGLKIPWQSQTGKFEVLLTKYTYLTFLLQLQQANRMARSLTREKAEVVWRFVVREKWDSWRSELPLEERTLALNAAFDQVRL